MRLSEFASSIENFAASPHVQKIKLFAWYLYAYADKSHFTHADIKHCYEELALELPANLSAQLKDLTTKKPKELLQSKRGYSLEHRIREQLQSKYGQRETTIKIHVLLEQLPGKISNQAERNFLHEAIVCLKHDAPRAAIVMCWNLAFDHLCEYVLSAHLAAFNTQGPVRFQKHHANARVKQITKKEEFVETFKENEVIDICRSAGIISSNVNKILQEKLNRRNVAAHPNNITFTPLQAEDYISDIVNNVILVLV